jgi:hypothetical protein
MDFTIYDSSEKIIRVGSTSKKSIDVQALAGENILKGTCVDAKTHKIVNGEAVLLTKNELNKKIFNDREHHIPKIDMGGSNDGINAQINNFFAGHLPDLETWKKENYAKLREQAYPDFLEYIDAQVKIHSGNTALILEGQRQESAYFQACMDVKTRFPKAGKND